VIINKIKRLATRVATARLSLQNSNTRDSVAAALTAPSAKRPCTSDTANRLRALRALAGNEVPESPSAATGPGVPPRPLTPAEVVANEITDYLSVRDEDGTNSALRWSVSERKSNVFRACHKWRVLFSP
jgi:hypothetical protein